MELQYGQFWERRCGRNLLRIPRRLLIGGGRLLRIPRRLVRRFGWLFLGLVRRFGWLFLNRRGGRRLIFRLGVNGKSRDQQETHHGRQQFEPMDLNAASNH